MGKRKVKRKRKKKIEMQKLWFTLIPVALVEKFLQYLPQNPQLKQCDPNFAKLLL